MEISEKHKKLLESQNNLMELYHKKVQLIEELNRATRIKLVWPEAFDCGGCTLLHPPAGFNPKKDRIAGGYYYALKRADGEKRILTEQEYNFIVDNKK